MYFLGVLCLLSAAVALPTPEKLHTNLPALPPPPELKPKEEDKDERVIVDSSAPISDERLSESAEKSKEQNDKAKLDDIKVIHKDSKESKEWENSKEKSKESKEWEDSKEKSKESKEFKDSKEKSKEYEDSKERSKESKDSKEKSKESKESKEKSKESEEYINDMKISQEIPQEEQKDKDSKSKESMERFEEDVPVIVQVVKGPRGFLPDWITNFFENIKFPSIQWPFRRSEFRNDDLEPVYLVSQGL